jgi:hypothetical protein
MLFAKYVNGMGVLTAMPPTNILVYTPRRVHGAIRWVHLDRCGMHGREGDFLRINTNDRIGINNSFYFNLLLGSSGYIYITNNSNNITRSVILPFTNISLVSGYYLFTTDYGVANTLLINDICALTFVITGDPGIQGPTGSTGATGPAGSTLGSITAFFDAGVGVISAGSRVVIPGIAFNGTITGWQIFETSDTPISSSCVVDVWKDTYANFPPVVGDSIFTTKPTLSSAIKNENLSPTFIGAGASVSVGDSLIFNIDSNTSARRLSVVLRITKV